MLEEKRTGNKRSNGEIVSLDELVSKFHMLRKIDRAIDWRKIYPIVENKFSKIGRPSVIPTVLVKMVILQHLYGLRSLRQTVAEIKVNVAYRWFIGYGLTEWIPHFSTVGNNSLHRILRLLNFPNRQDIKPFYNKTETETGNTKAILETVQSAIKSANAQRVKVSKRL